MVTRADCVRAALQWVTSILDRRQVPYQIVGGLAAIAHGATRPLHDIDLYAPLTGQDRLLKDLRPNTVWGPEHYRDESWDLVFMKVHIDGVRVEIGDSSSHPRYFDRSRAAWKEQVIDYHLSNRLTVFGVSVNVMPLPDLLVYKKGLAREVDHQDIRELNRLSRPGSEGNPGAFSIRTTLRSQTDSL